MRVMASYSLPRSVGLTPSLRRNPGRGVCALRCASRGSRAVLLPPLRCVRLLRWQRVERCLAALMHALIVAIMCITAAYRAEDEGRSGRCQLNAIDSVARRVGCVAFMSWVLGSAAPAAAESAAGLASVNASHSPMAYLSTLQLSGIGVTTPAGIPPPLALAALLLLTAVTSTPADVQVGLI
jgi:hypothetical protein